MRAKKVLLSTVAVALLTGGSLPAAHAIDELYSRHGDDYSLNGSDAHSISACDRERDGNTVYANYWIIGVPGSSSVTDTTGSSGGCGDRYFSQMRVWSHQVVENANGPNYYGQRVYPK